MSHDDFEHQDVEELTDEFESDLEGVISEIYPTLCDRIAHSNFAGWHRRVGTAEDLANQASFEFLKHCKKKRRLPEDPLRYLVVIARHIAQKEYGRSEKRDVEFEKYATELLARGEPTTYDTVQPDALVESEEHIEIVRAAIDLLPLRQRQAFELRTLDPSATYKELGKQMGISEDGFRKNFERAQGRVRELLLTQIKGK